MAWTVTAIVCLVLGSVPSAAGAPAAREAVLFSIAKSENENQVQYSVRVDDRCAPVGAKPVFAYWRLREEGPNRRAPLLSREQRAYGIASQWIEAGNWRLLLRALSRRPIDVQALRGADGSCQAVARMTINGSPAYLFNVYLKLKWPFGVDYMLLRGWSLDRTHTVTERLTP